MVNPSQALQERLGYIRAGRAWRGLCPMTPHPRIRAPKSAFFKCWRDSQRRQDPAIPGHEATSAVARASSAAARSFSLPTKPGPPLSSKQRPSRRPYLEDPAARRVAGDVLAGVEHAQRHAVEQDHQHAHPLEPPARHPVKETTGPDEHPRAATAESERLFWSLQQGARQLL